MSSQLSQIPGIDPVLAQTLATGLEQVETRLYEIVAIDDTMVAWTARHLLDAGGKRVRPTLTLLAAALAHEPTDGSRSEQNTVATSYSSAVLSQHVIDTAVLCELTHLATLYHDDVMDSAPTRRGTPSVHEVWSNSVAILTGDFLFARASALSSTISLEAVREHSKTFERLCLGQLHETVGPQADDDPIDHYLRVLSGKTASLLALCGYLGASVVDATASTAETLRRYGEKVGVAFQLADDVLDLSAPASTSGKQPGTDLREGVPTMPTLLLQRRAQSGDAAAAHLWERIQGDLSDDDVLAEVVSELREDPCMGEAHEVAVQYAEEALEIMRELPLHPARDALIAFTHSLVDRQR